MYCKSSILAFVCWITAATGFNDENSLGTCTDLSCAPREVLLEQIRMLQKRIHEEEPTYSSSKRSWFETRGIDEEICGSCLPKPCQNGGKCIVDKYSPIDKYTCDCPDDTCGTNCEHRIVCNATSCGPNAVCKVVDQQMTCTCKPGYSGDATRPDGCENKMVETCVFGDPHYRTFDGLYFDFQGTCPYIFSTPCSQLANGYDYFIVKGRNEIYPKGSNMSAVREAEIIMFGNKIYVDALTNIVTLNGMEVFAPHTWRGDNGEEISIKYTGGKFFVKNLKEMLTVTLKFNQLCIQIPDVPEFRGNCTLCGLAGNLDGNYLNDIATSRKCTFFNATQRFNTDYNPTLLEALDHWKADSFHSTSDFGNCSNGNETTVTPCTEKLEVMQKCMPINDALTNRSGLFAACKELGEDIIRSAYNSCVFDVCAGVDRCAVFGTFVQQCMSYLPNTNLGDWRAALECEMLCPANSKYKSCMTTCPITCAEPNRTEICYSGCTEGCECDSDFYLDTSILNHTTCVRREHCGCTDRDGNMRRANTTWLTDDCDNLNFCVNGEYQNKFHPCHVDGICVKKGMEEKCKCKEGYEGDGYECREINECDNASTCGQAEKRGTCMNLPGSYKCECAEGFLNDGKDCIDINECANATLCGQAQYRGNCTNLPGSYKCECFLHTHGKECEEECPTCSTIAKCPRRADDPKYCYAVHLNFVRTGYGCPVPTFEECPKSTVYYLGPEGGMPEQNPAEPKFACGENQKLTFTTKENPVPRVLERYYCGLPKRNETTEPSCPTCSTITECPERDHIPQYCTPAQLKFVQTGKDCPAPAFETCQTTTGHWLEPEGGNPEPEPAGQKFACGKSGKITFTTTENPVPRVLERIYCGRRELT